MTGTKELPVFNNVCIQIFCIDFEFSAVMGCLARGSQLHHFAPAVHLEASFYPGKFEQIGE